MLNNPGYKKVNELTSATYRKQLRNTLFTQQRETAFHTIENAVLTLNSFI